MEKPPVTWKAVQQCFYGITENNDYKMFNTVINDMCQYIDTETYERFARIPDDKNKLRFFFICLLQRRNDFPKIYTELITNESLSPNIVETLKNTVDILTNVSEDKPTPLSDTFEDNEKWRFWHALSMTLENEQTREKFTTTSNDLMTLASYMFSKDHINITSLLTILELKYMQEKFDRLILCILEIKDNSEEIFADLINWLGTNDSLQQVSQSLKENKDKVDKYEEEPKIPKKPVYISRDAGQCRLNFYEFSNFTTSKETLRKWPLNSAEKEKCRKEFEKLMKNVSLGASLVSEDSLTTPLMQAVHSKNSAKVTSLLSEPKIKDNINELNPDGQTVLIIAACGDETQILESLLQVENIKTEIRDSRGMSVLCYIYLTKNVKMLETYVRYHPEDLVNTETEGIHPLWYLFMGELDMDFECEVMVNQHLARNFRNATKKLFDTFREKNSSLEKQKLSDMVSLILKHSKADTKKLLLLAIFVGNETVVALCFKDIQFDISECLSLLICAILCSDTELVKQMLPPLEETLKQLPTKKLNDVISSCCYINKTDITKAVLQSGIGLINNAELDTLFFDIARLQELFKSASYDDPGEKAQKLLKNLKVGARDIDGNTLFLLASEFCNRDAVKTLMNMVAIDVYAVNECKQNALMLSTFNTHSDVTEVLLENGKFDLNASDTNNETVLAYFYNARMTGLAGELVSKIEPKEINTGDSNGVTILHNACTSGEITIVKKLLENENVDLTIKDKNGYNALMKASGEGHVEVAALLLKKEMNVNEQSANGTTALILASANGSKAIVNEIFKRPETDVNIQDENGQTALIHAVLNKHKTIVTVLVNRDDLQINIQDKYGMTAYAYSNEMFKDLIPILFKKPNIDITIIREGEITYQTPTQSNTDIMRQLLDQEEIDVNVTDRKQLTALFYACSENDIPSAQLLLEKENTNVNAVEVNNRTGFFIACKRNFVDMVRMLLGYHKVDVNIQDINGDTGFVVACDGGFDELVAVLLEHPPVEVNIQNMKGEAGLMASIIRRHVTTVAILLQCQRLSFNLTDTNGQNGFMVACHKGHSKIVTKMLDYPEVEVNAKDNTGNTAFTLACKMEHIPVIVLLISSMCLDYERTEIIDAANSLVSVDKLLWARLHEGITDYLKSTFPSSNWELEVLEYIESARDGLQIQ